MPVPKISFSKKPPPISTATLELYAKAKALVEFTQAYGTTGKKLEGKCWKYHKFVHVKKGKEAELRALDPSAMDAMEEYAPCILCEVCFEDAGKSLDESLVHAKDAMHASNRVKHLRRQHNIHCSAKDGDVHNEFGTLLPQKRGASDETASTLTVGQGPGKMASH